MLKVIVELHPFGNSARKTKIAEMDLWNTGNGSREVGNYQATSTVEPSPWNGDPEHRGGTVLDHPRNQSVWTLVAKMLKACGYSAEKVV